MLGYATNQQGYYVLNLETNRTEVTRNAIFEEDLNQLRSEEVKELLRKHN